MIKVIPVIMSGGSGTRLWPLSTPEQPKQFHSLTSRRTLFQETVARVTGSSGGLEFGPPVIVASLRHRSRIGQELEALGASPGAVLLEPVPRNTAGVAVLAALAVRELDPQALVLLLSSDHVVRDTAAFHDALRRGSAVAGRHVVTLGIEPSGPATGYGYVKRGRQIGEGVFEAAKFKEKPDLDTARAYLAEGGYTWNAGMFLYAPNVMLTEMGRASGDIVSATTAAYQAARRDGAYVDLPESAFEAIRSISVDHALLEVAPGAVVTCDIGWADVGSWSELWRLRASGAGDTVTHGDVVALEAPGSLVWSTHRKVLVLGVEDLVVVETAEAVLVLPKCRAEEVKTLLAASPFSSQT